jgi:LPS sulfotransferase NodH
VINKLYQSAHDFAGFHGKPLTEYMLATMPRSGSTYFAIELWRTGVLGAPMEYANTPYISLLGERMDFKGDIVEYWDKVRSIRTSPNGMFGFKMFMRNYKDCQDDHPDLLREIAPDKVIYLTRRDVLEQAVSYSKAIQSKAWFHGVKVASEPVYSFDDIRECEQMIRYQMAFWESLFELTCAEVHRVTYEDLLSSPTHEVQKVADFLNVRLDPASILEIDSIEMQRNAQSMEWVGRYRDEAGSKAVVA